MIVADRVPGVVDAVIDLAPEVAAGVQRIDIAYFPLNGQGRLVPAVLIRIRPEVRNFEIAHLWIVDKCAVGIRILVEILRRDRPRIGEIEFKRSPATIVGQPIEIIVRGIVIVESNGLCTTRRGRSLVCHGAWDIAYIAAVVPVVAH